MRAVCYCRVSSAAQRERDTIASQLRVLPEYIARQGWTLARPADAYVDDGRTARAGKLDARTGLAALLRDAAAGAFDVVCVVDIDRLTRSEDLAERGAILGAFQRSGVRVASASTGQVLDLSTSIGDLFGTLHAFFAAEENRKRAERVRTGKLTGAQRGAKTTGRGPWWLRYDRERAAWEVDAERAAVVVEMFARAAAGETCTAIAIDLDVRGVAPPGARPWNKSRVRDVIRSRAPVGEWIAHRRTRTTTSVPAVVDEALWQRANAAVDRHRKLGLRQRTRHVYLLEGLAVCGSCGAPMRIKSANTDRRRGVYNPARYVCASKQHWRPAAIRTSSCDAPSVPTADADARAWAALCGELEDPGLPAELAADRRARAADSHDWERDAAGYRAHLTRLDKVAEGLLVRYRRGALEGDELDRELALVSRERAAVRAQLATAERAGGSVRSAQARADEAVALVERMRAALASATPQERREIFAAVVDPGGVTFLGSLLRVELWLERPAARDVAAPALGSAPFWRDDHQSRRDACLRIRVVA